VPTATAGELATPPPKPGSTRSQIARGLVGAGLVALIGILALLASGGQLPVPQDTPSLATTPLDRSAGESPSIGPATLTSVQAAPHLVFQNVARGDQYAEVSLVPLDRPDGERVMTGLVCERVHFAGGHGLCLAGEHGAESIYHAVTFQSDFQPRARVRLEGTPNLARVSPDGRYGAASVLVSGTSAVEAGPAMDTVLIDMSEGAVIGALKDFSVVPGDLDVAIGEFDAWGVTFGSASERFYATIRSAGNVYLVEGDLATRELLVLHPSVWSPSLSPDEQRIAYPKLVSNIGPTWRFHVLDLSTMAETPLAESKSIDDQVEWLDDGSVLYGLSTDIWHVAADGSGEPRVFLSTGLSPAVVK
jgi:hypothetical protein